MRCTRRLRTHTRVCAYVATAWAGVVLKVIDKYTGEIEMLDSGDVIRVDQAHCETVLPVWRRAETQEQSTGCMVD